MFSICEYLNVCKKDSIPDGSLIEECGDFYPEVLDSFCIICRDHEMKRVEDWIRQNITQNTEHCVKMFLHSPGKFLSFIRSSRHVTSYTDEFINAAGGIQGFLDTYTTNSMGNYGNVCNSMIPADSIAEEHTDTASESVPLFHEKQSANSINGAEHLAEPYKDELPVANTKSTKDDTLDSSLDTLFDNKNGSKSEPVVESVVKRVEVIEEVHKIQNYDPKLITQITDEDILDSLMHLRELDSRISLDGLDPGMVLNDSQLKQAYDMIESYPPAVLKEFVLDLLTCVNSNVERIRVSSLLDDFATYICEKMGVLE